MKWLLCKWNKTKLLITYFKFKELFDLFESVRVVDEKEARAKYEKREIVLKDELQVKISLLQEIELYLINREVNEF
jgi:hypothetical protein